MSTNDRTERQLEAWLEETARPMPQYVLESSLETVARTGQVSPAGRFGIRWLNRPGLTLGAAAAVVLLAVALGPALLDRFERTGPGAVPSPACAPSPSGLTGWWPGDGTVDDVIGGRDAEVIGGATFVPGRVGDAFGLDGQDDFVDVADDPALDVGRQDFSVALWVWFNDTAGEQILVEKWVQRFNGPSRGWTLTKLGDNTLGVFTEDGLGSDHGVRTDPLVLPARSWTHVVARRIGGTVDLFINGQRAATTTDPSAILDLDSDAPLKFGHRGSPGDTPGSEDTNGYFLDGLIDEVQLVIGRALTDDEIDAGYRAGAAGSCEP